MAKLFGWLKKRDEPAQKLAAARARVETAQQALLPFAPGLTSARKAELQEAEKLWNDALVVEKRGDEESLSAALKSYEDVAARLATLRRAEETEHPELALRALLARTAENADEVEDRTQRCQAWLELFRGHLGLRDEPGARHAVELALELVENGAELRQCVQLAVLLHGAEKSLPAEAWIREASERVIARLHDWDEGDPEREGQLFFLLETQASLGSLDAARSTLARLDGEFRDEGLRAIAEALAGAGDLAGARATLDEIASESFRHEAEALVVEAVTRGPKAAEALAFARAIADEGARSLALTKIAGARARAGEIDPALTLLSELPPERHDELRLEVLEGALARGDLATVERMLDSLESAEAQKIAWQYCSESIARVQDSAAAGELAARIPEAYARAMAFESLAWKERRAGNEDAARKLFAVALETASEALHTRGAGRTPVGGNWLVLAGRIQVTAGAALAAMDCVANISDPELRGTMLQHLGMSAGAGCDLDSVEVLLSRATSAAERSWILSGANQGLSSRLRKPE